MKALLVIIMKLCLHVTYAQKPDTTKTFFDFNIKKSPWKGMHTTHYAYPFQGEFNVITRSKLDFFT